MQSPAPVASIARTGPADGYSIWMALVYVFNLMVGTGALALPAALARAGWALGAAAVVALALASFLAATYVIEAHATVNALRSLCRTDTAHQAGRECEEEAEGDTETEAGARYGEGEEPLVSRTEPAPSAEHYSLDRRVELGEMARVLLGSGGRTLFYITLCLYLYGDLSIYSAAVANSLMDVICTWRPEGWEGAVWGNASLPAEAPCRAAGAGAGAWPATRGDCYRVALLSFTAALAPFTLFNVQKTKYLQLFTTAMRWLAFCVMVCLACWSLARRGALGRPPAAAPAATPALFGTCVYAFMCHHSLPALLAPARDKRRLAALLALDYALIAAFYLLLALTGAFAFAHLEPLYTLNFAPERADAPAALLAHYFLALFPVFALAASYPIVAVTLRSNLEGAWCGGGGGGGWGGRAACALLAVAPPLLLTLGVRDVGVLVSVTGGLAGAGVQYAAPAALVAAARRRAPPAPHPPPHASPLRHRAGPPLLHAWAAGCVLLLVAHFCETHF